MAGMFLTGRPTFNGVRRRHDPRRRRRHDRLADRAARLLAVLGDRVDKGRLPFLRRLPPARRRRRASWGAVRRSRPAPPAALGRPRGRRSCSPWPRRRCSMNTGQPGHDDAAAEPPVGEDLQQDREAFPGGPVPARRRGQGRRRRRARGPGRDRRPPGAGARVRPVARADRRRRATPTRTIARVSRRRSRATGRTRRRTRARRRCATTLIPATRRQASPAPRPTSPATTPARRTSTTR